MPTNSSILFPTCESYSPFEQLPCELTWKIIEYVPESILELMLTSHCLLHRVNEYAQQRSIIKLVEQLNIARDQFGVIKIDLFVPKSNSTLLELRMKFMQLHIENLIKRTCDDKNPNEYRYECSLLSDNEEVLEYLGECIGSRTRKATLFNCAESNEMILVSKLLKGIHFERLSVIVETLSETAKSSILSLIDDHNASQFLLIMRNVSCSDPVAFLLQLSSLVHSLHLHQLNPFGRIRRHRYFFGIYNEDWSKIILDMFSLNLGKLCITNRYCPEYLSKTEADCLRESLPSIGKDIWFEATCNKYEAGLNYMKNNHSIKAKRRGVYGGSLRIRHTSREEESFE